MKAPDPAELIKADMKIRDFLERWFPVINPGMFYDVYSLIATAALKGVTLGVRMEREGMSEEKKEEFKKILVGDL